MTLNTGDTFLGKYRIEQLLGEGSFGEVYRATHLELRVPRALKVLRREAPGVGSTQFGMAEQRFRLEAQLGARIKHPRLLEVYDFEQAKGTLALVMDYAPGGNLAHRIESTRDRDHAIPIPDATMIAMDIAAGLAALHARDVIHRDLKPSNILFDVDGHAVVADLGLAQVPGGPSRRSVMSEGLPHPGTPAYMSPEQRTSTDHLPPASDVYALGAVMFEVLTGRLFRNAIPGTRVGDLRADVPEWLDDLVARMVSDDPRHRPWNGDQVVAALRDSLEANQRAREEADRRAKEESERREREEAEHREHERLAALAQAEAAKQAKAEAERREREETERRQREEAERRTREDAERRQREEADRQARDRQLELARTVGVDQARARMASERREPTAPPGREERILGSREAGQAAMRDAERSTWQQAKRDTPPRRAGPVPTPPSARGGLPSWWVMVLGLGCLAVLYLGWLSRTPSSLQEPLSQQAIPQTPTGGPIEAQLATETSATLVVPDVVGLMRSEARATLEARGFTVAFINFYSSDVPSDVVVRQSPDDGDAAAVGTTVTVVVSLGAPSPPTATPVPATPVPTAAPAQPATRVPATVPAAPVANMAAPQTHGISTGNEVKQGCERDGQVGCCSYYGTLTLSWYSDLAPGTAFEAIATITGRPESAVSILTTRHCDASIDPAAYCASIDSAQQNVNYEWRVRVVRQSDSSPLSPFSDAREFYNDTRFSPSHDHSDDRNPVGPCGS